MKKRTLVFGLMAGAVLSACAQIPPNTAPPAVAAPAPIGGGDDLRRGGEPVSDPSDIRIELYDPEKETVEITELRRQALQEAAQGYGSQLGYARRVWEIEGLLEERSSDLDEVFGFERVVSEAPVKTGYIVPPIVSRSFDAFQSSEEGRAASVADEYLTIVAPGRIVPVTPTWRDYLLFGGADPEKPARSLFPSNEAERELFLGWFNEGWTAGVKLADEEIGHRLTRLRRDYEGMLQYRRLVNMGMMDRMVLQEADFGVTGGGDEMRIGSRTVRIVSDAQFDADPLRWTVREVGPREREIVSTGEIPALGSLY
jgi:defect-in-organelle-trafficking protein DotC